MLLPVPDSLKGPPFLEGKVHLENSSSKEGFLTGVHFGGSWWGTWVDLWGQMHDEIYFAICMWINFHICFTNPINSFSIWKIWQIPPKPDIFTWIWDPRPFSLALTISYAWEVVLHSYGWVIKDAISYLYWHSALPKWDKVSMKIEYIMQWSGPVCSCKASAARLP